MTTSGPFPPSPFDPAPRRPFSWRPWLIAGGAFVTLVFVAGLMLLAKQNEILAWTLTTLEQRLEPRLTELTPETRARLTAAFETARGAILEKKFNLFALERAQTKAMAGSSGPLSEEAAAALAEALEAVAVKPEPAHE
jgi:hypothetical protein